MTHTHETQIGGKTYKVILANIGGKPVVWVRVVREQKDGTKIDAFLSQRQQAAESRARQVFAKEIKQHMAC